jgi:hypothetical protein
VKEVDEHEKKEILGETQAQRSKLAIPARHSKKFTQLVEASTGTIGANRAGEVVIRGEPLRNTSYSDVMRALYVDSKFTIPGLAETVSELKRLGVNTSLFTSHNARQLYSASASKRKSVSQQKGSGIIRHKSFPRMLRLY